MGTIKTYRFRNYDIRTDDTAEPTYAAECVTGDDADCGARSGEEVEGDKLNKWIAGHVRDTGHERHRVTTTNYAVATPGEWQ